MVVRGTVNYGDTWHYGCRVKLQLLVEQVSEWYSQAYLEIGRSHQQDEKY